MAIVLNGHRLTYSINITYYRLLYYRVLLARPAGRQRPRGRGGQQPRPPARLVWDNLSLSLYIYIYNISLSLSLGARSTYIFSEICGLHELTSRWDFIRDNVKTCSGWEVRESHFVDIIIYCIYIYIHIYIIYIYIHTYVLYIYI